tara:strand:+ start:5977 stop:7161 length:1185 start_codon:yes stop_codon:yes gene_type:complete
MKKDIIPYGKHFIDQDDIDAVVDVLKNKNLTQGPAVLSFEKAIANYVGSKYAVAISSWTAGLHIAYLAAGLKEGDELITTPLTFVATSNAALYCGAKPVFSDIDPQTINLCPDKLSRTVKEHPKAKIIAPVHFAGLACKMKEIKNMADKNKLLVIEDAAHALGAKYEDGSMVGNCKYSLMTGFSFHPVKSIAAGEGGMITTNNREIYRKLLRLRSHGINKYDDIFKNKHLAFTNGLNNPWYYEMQELGYNFRITDIQSTLGESQLKKLNNFIARRLEIVERYDLAFKTFKNINPIQSKTRAQSSHHIYPVRINFKKVKISRAKLMKTLSIENILTQVHYMPVPMHPYYHNLDYKIDDFQNSLNYYEEALTLPLYFGLSDQDQDKVIRLLKKIIG